jgi:hypothetical protein
MRRAARRLIRMASFYQKRLSKRHSSLTRVSVFKISELKTVFSEFD